MAKTPESRALRRGRCSIPGQTYLITATTHQRAPHFAAVETARTVAQLCHDQSTWGDALVSCWVLMPDHWHGIIQVGPGTNLSRCIGRFKARITRSLGRIQGIDIEIWQRGFHDHAVRRNEDLKVLARYVVLNPVRAGLVDHIGQYPYWNAIWL